MTAHVRGNPYGVRVIRNPKIFKGAAFAGMSIIATLSRCHFLSQDIPIRAICLGQELTGFGIDFVSCVTQSEQNISEMKSVEC